MIDIIKNLLNGQKNENKSNQVRKSIPIKSFEENLVKLRDNHYRAYIKISPVNQDNLTDDDLEEVVEVFQEIYNSEPGMVQLKVSSEPPQIDLYEEYVDQVVKNADNAYFLERIHEYKDYIQKRKNKSKNQKRFYFILRSAHTDLEGARTEIKDKVSLIKEKLAKKDMIGSLMEEDEVKDLLYRKLNPQTSQLQPYDREMSEYDIYPDHIDYQRSQIEYDGVYYRHFVIVDYPKGMKKPCWFNSFINKSNVEVDIFLKPGDISKVEKSISNSIGELEVRLEDNPPAWKKSKYNREKKSQEDMLEEIQDNTAYEVTVLITVFERSLEKLESAAKRIQYDIRSNRMRSKALVNRYFEPMLLNLPLCYDSHLLNRFHWGLHSKLVAAMMPFNASEITASSGTIWGYNPDNDSFIIIDRFDRSKYNNGNGVTLGGSGSGKTFISSIEIDRAIKLNNIDRAVVVDPEREYMFPYGNRINFETGGKDCTNPFFFRSYILDADEDHKDGVAHAGKFMMRQTSDIVSWMKWIYPSMSTEEQGINSRIIRQCFVHHGLKENMEDVPMGYEPPTLDTFSRFAKEEPKLETTLNIFDPYINGEYKSLFNGHTTWDLNHRLTVLDIHNLQAGVQSPVYDLILKDIWNDFKRNRKERKGAYVDEAHRLVNKHDLQTLIFIVNCFKRFRKYGAYIEIITQNVADILAAGQEYAAQILANASFKKFMFMEKSDWEALLQIQTLSEKELRVVKKRVQQGRGVIIAQDQRAFIQSEATMDELKFIDPDKYNEIMALQELA